MRDGRGCRSDARVFQIAVPRRAADDRRAAARLLAAACADGAGLRRRARDAGVLAARAQDCEQKGFLSAIVTCCGLSLLLRSDTLWVHPLAAALAMSSKFVLRVNGKHLYNPANLGVIAAITLLPGTVGFAGPMGQRSRARRLVPDARHRRHEPRAALATSLDVSRRLARTGRACASLCSGQPWADLVASARQRRAAAVRVLHDLRSDDDSEPARRAHRLRADRRGRPPSAGSICCSGPTRCCGRCSCATPLVPLFDRL